MKLELNILEEKMLELMHEGLSINEFEQWVYATSELQTLLSPEDYLLLISLNYKRRDVMIELENIINKYIDYGKFEAIKVVTLLKKALNKDKDIGNILRQFYYMYCNGYYFFEDLGLGYGLACEVPLKYANTWEELNDKQKFELISSFYPEVENDIKRALDWIENKKIVLTGKKDHMNRWQFVDYRTPDEKKSTVWFEAGANQKYRLKSSLVMKKHKKWWEFW